MSSYSGSEEEVDLRFLLPQDVGETEDVEKYRPGGFHPVHLGDQYDERRYRVVHKLGAGGFSTVWLARDEKEKRWVALKIVVSKHSASTCAKSALSGPAIQESETRFVTRHQRHFTFEGPNGRHLCLVLPVHGPSTAELSYELNCRLTPWLARRVAYQATRAVTDLHSQGLCHGDVTTGNVLLSISDLDCYGEADIYRLFGQPVTGVLETESGEETGPEAPRYIVKNIDFLSASSSVVEPDIKLVDFDQCFPVSSPPKTLLGTPLEFLAPEVAVGLAAGPASDVWALGCCILRLRSGRGPFSSPFDVTCPEDLVSYIIHTLGGAMPPSWQASVLWDSEGYPTKDASKGKPHDQWWDGPKRSLRDVVYNIWDEPKDRTVQTGAQTSNPKRESPWDVRERQPLPSQFSALAWKPGAVKVDDTYLTGYNKEWDRILEALPKIPGHEAALLYDLLSKIFILDPTSRLTAKEMLDHPWFHLDTPSNAT